MGLGIGIFDKVTGAVVDFVGTSIEQGKKLQSATSSAQKSFTTLFSTVQKDAASAAKSFGVSAATYMQQSANISDAAKARGFSEKEAYDITRQTWTLAADLAAKSGLTVQEALDSLGAAYRGEFDSVEKFGLSIKQSDINTVLAAKGMDKLTGEALKQATQMATLELATKQGAVATGAWAESQDTASIKQQQNAAAMENAAGKLGEKLLPAITAVQGFIADSFIPAISDLVDWLGGVWRAIEPVVKEISNALMPIIKKVVSFIQGTWIPMLTKVAQTVLPILWNAIKTVASVAGTVFGAVTDIIGKAVSFIGSAINTAITVFKNLQTGWNTVTTAIRNGINSFVDFFRNMPTRIGSALGNLFKPLWEGFRSVLNSIIRAWNSLKFTVPSIELPGLGKIGGFTIGTPNLPYFHAGGIVPGAKGQDVPIMAQAGERIVPANRADSGGGITIIFQGPVYGDERSMDELAKKFAKRMYALT